MWRFTQVTIVGLGLIGGSLGMALRRRRLARKVVGFSRKPSTLRRAKRTGAIDEGFTDLRRAARDADLVVLATPVDAIVPLAKRLVGAMCDAGSTLTDVGSTKAGIVRQIQRILPAGVHFVGGHPIAGSEQQGIEAASAGLFDGSLCVLTRTPRTNPTALATVKHFWMLLGCRVEVMMPRDHDRLLAMTSHLPHAVAFSLAGALPASLACAPRSLLDMTRIAQSDPDLWDDIFLTNRAFILKAMDRFDGQWRALRRALAASDRAALRRFLAASKSRRETLDAS